MVYLHVFRYSYANRFTNFICEEICLARSHRTLMTVRLGSDEACNFATAGNVTSHPCRAREVRLWRGVKWWRPEFVIFELEMFKDTRLVMPA